jgi:hypothetical protein
MNKYDPLENYLSACGQDSVTLTFGEIESIIGDTLPPTAYQMHQWWANSVDEHNMHVQQKAWYGAGYRSAVHLKEQQVTFVRL